MKEKTSKFGSISLCLRNRHRSVAMHHLSFVIFAAIFLGFVTKVQQNIHNEEGSLV
jgi:hypothetical protein